MGKVSCIEKQLYRSTWLYLYNILKYTTCNRLVFDIFLFLTIYYDMLHETLAIS